MLSDSQIILCLGTCVASEGPAAAVYLAFLEMLWCVFPLLLHIISERTGNRLEIYKPSLHRIYLMSKGKEGTRIGK